jgi:excisionase family DNA binding protein
MLTKPMLTVHDAADFLKVRESTVRGLINDKRLRAVKIGKEWRIAQVDLLAFLNENANREPDGPDATTPDGES